MHSSKKEVDLDRWRRVRSLRARGWTHKRIAEELHITLSAVARVLRRSEPPEETGELDSSALRVHQTRQLELIAQEALRGWRRSKRDTVTQKTTEQSVQAKGKEPAKTQVKIETTREKQSGSPNYLAQAREALADIRKMWDVDSTNSVSPPPPTGIDPEDAEDLINQNLKNESKLGRGDHPTTTVVTPEVVRKPRMNRS
jgi:predicted transcriptional regulator